MYIGLSCQHAMAAIGYVRYEVEEYMPTYFTRHAYPNTYSMMFINLLDQCTREPIERPLIDPPTMEKKIRQPKKSRKKQQMSLKNKKRQFFIIWSFCDGSNHNVRSCPLKPSFARGNRVRNNNSHILLYVTIKLNILYLIIILNILLLFITFMIIYYM